MTTETQTPAGANSASGAVAPGGNAPAPSPLIPPAPAPAAAPADPAKPGDAPKPADPPAEVVYDIKAPEGFEFKGEHADAFKALAKDSKLTPEAAQKFADAGYQLIQRHTKAQQDQVNAMHAQWETDARTDKEFGGDNLQASLGIAKKFLDAFDEPTDVLDDKGEVVKDANGQPQKVGALAQLLTKTKLGNHPAVIRAMFRAGQKMKDDTLVTGTTRPAGSETSSAQRLYPNMNP